MDKIRLLTVPTFVGETFKSWIVFSTQNLQLHLHTSDGRVDPNLSGRSRKRPGLIRVEAKGTSINQMSQDRFNPTRPELAAPTGRSRLCFLAPTHYSSRPELVAPAGRI